MRDDKLDALLKELMDGYAEELGRQYMKENECLQADPSAAVPPELEQRALDLIRKMTSSPEEPGASARRKRRTI